MQKIVRGFCPEAKKELTVSVEYLYSESFQETKWVKDKVNCPIASSGLCATSECPLKAMLPENLPV